MTPHTSSTEKPEATHRYEPGSDADASSAGDGQQSGDHGPEDNGGSDGGTSSGSDGKGSAWMGVFVLFLMATPIVGSAIYNVLGLKDQKVVVVTSAVKSDSVWSLSGRVLYDGEPMIARVSAVVSNSLGNRFAPASVTTDSAGYFALAPVRDRLSSDSARGAASEVLVMARGRSPHDTVTVRGEETLRLSNQSRTRWVRLPPSILGTVVAIFIVSVIVGIWQAHTDIGKKVQYYGTIALAFLLTVALIVFISMGLRGVNLTGGEGDVIALGFANIYKGTYVKDIPPEWLFSLTAPWQAVPGPTQLARGFGAPLWALLLAVVGSGLYTIRLIVQQVHSPVDINDLTKFRARLQEVVQHQFYIFFAPVGAVFVYQLLVISGAASVETTVAIAMLAAGAVLNALLDRALVAAQRAVEERQRTKEQQDESLGASPKPARVN